MTRYSSFGKGVEAVEVSASPALEVGDRSAGAGPAVIVQQRVVFINRALFTAVIIFAATYYSFGNGTSSEPSREGLAAEPATQGDHTDAREPVAPYSSQSSLPSVSGYASDGWSLGRSKGWWPSDASAIVPVAHNTTAITKLLLESLHELNKINSLGFGQQYANYQGQNWPWFEYWGQYDKSDVYNDTHDYPLVFGYDLQDYLKGRDYAEYIKWAGNRGAIVSFSWLADNPATGGDAYNNSCAGMNLLKEVMPGGKLNDKWVAWLDSLSDLFESLTFTNGEKIPFVFRLFHEGTAWWYWWGTKCNTDLSYVGAWNYTAHYLQNVKGHRNIIWEYAPSKPSQLPEEFMAYYPGDDLVDVVSFDRYAKNETYDEYLINDCTAVVDFAKAHNKVTVLAETGIWLGIQNVTEADWYIKRFLKPIMQHCPSIAYSLTYTSFSKDDYWVPLKGQKTYPGFMALYNDEHSVFLNDSYWRKLKYYEYVDHLQDTSCVSPYGKCGGASGPESGGTAWYGTTNCCNNADTRLLLGTEDVSFACFTKDETYSQCTTQCSSGWDCDF